MIKFECLGFASNPVFVMDSIDDKPVCVGWVMDRGGDLHFYPWGGAKVDEQAILVEYEKQFKERGVVISDTSKEAWLKGQFGDRTTATDHQTRTVEEIK